MAEEEETVRFMAEENNSTTTEETAVTPTSDDQKQPKFSLRKLEALWQITAGERLRYTAAIGALVVASSFLYLVPMVVKIILDSVIATEPVESGKWMLRVSNTFVETFGGRDYLRSHLWVPGLVIALFAAAASFFTYLRGRWSARASEGIIRKLRDKLYDHLQHLPCRYFDGAETGDLIQRCTSDVETVRLFLATQAVEIGRALIMMLLPIPVMLMIDVRMTGLSVVLIPFIVAYSAVFFLRVKKAFLKMDEAEGRMTATVQENLTGVRVVRAFARQDFEIEQFDERNQQHRDLDRKLYNIFALFWGVSDLMCFIQIGVVVIAGTYWLAAGSLPFGSLTFFLFVVSLFTFPMRMMGRILSDLGKAVVALGRIEEILEESIESIVDQDLRTNPTALEGRVTFDNVTFAHGENTPVLHDVSFNIDPGKTLAILGPSGCGKSTIINLLLRLYDFEQGSIQIDGLDLTTLDRKYLRSQMAVVMQEPFLFSRSLRENIKLGKRGALEEEMLEATSIACIHESITEFDEGYDTVVGERGATLSGGQRQRVAIARALLLEPAVLVLDDALSAVDTETETVILDALRSRRGKHTTIVIAHRLSTVLNADEIIVLDHGRIVQAGSHRELLKEEGLYARLWQIQGATDSNGVQMNDDAEEVASVSTA